MGRARRRARGWKRDWTGEYTVFRSCDGGARTEWRKTAVKSVMIAREGASGTGDENEPELGYAAVLGRRRVVENHRFARMAVTSHDVFCDGLGTSGICSDGWVPLHASALRHLANMRRNWRWLRHLDPVLRWNKGLGGMFGRTDTPGSSTQYRSRAPRPPHTHTYLYTPISTLVTRRDRSRR